MNRSDLIRATADAHGIPLAEAEKILNTITDMIAVSLACGEPVLISRFGKFESRMRDACIRKNPRTGADIEVPAKQTVLFHAAPALKKRINKNP